MDITDFPEWYLDLIREAQQINYGRIPLELVVAAGKITKVIGTKSKQVKFRDTTEGKIYMLDLVNTKLKDAAASANSKDGTITLSLVHKGDKITQINGFDTVEHNYPL